MDFDLLTFVLFAVSTLAAGAALVGFGTRVILDSGLSEMRRAAYAALALAPSIGWIIYAVWVWGERGAAFTFWSAVVGLAIPGLATLAILAWKRDPDERQEG